MRVVGSGDHAHRTHSNWEHIWAAYDSAGEATLLFLWIVANKEPYRTIADRFDVSISSFHRAIRRVTQGVIDRCGRYIKWPNGEYSSLLTEMHTYFDVKQYIIFAIAIIWE